MMLVISIHVGVNVQNHSF